MKENSTERLPGLDGIRAIAILMVLFFHYFNVPLDVRVGGFVEPGSVWAYLERFSNMFWSGVDLFFVLSGFLITRILLLNLHSPNLLKTFYVRRSLRIFPAYFFFILVFWLTATSAPLKAVYEQSLPPMWPYVLYVQNIYHWFIGSNPPAPLAPLWSLAVEEQFYLLLPIAILVFGLLRAPYLFIGALFISLLLRWFTPDYSWTFTPYRLDGLAFGGLLACYVARFGFPRFSYNVLLATLSALLGIFFWVSWVDPSVKSMPWAFSLFGILGLTLILLAVCHSERMIGRFLDCSPMMWLGRRSYFIYLWHQLVLFYLQGWYDFSAMAMSSAHSVAITFLAAAVTLVMSEISWRIFEFPLLKRGQQFNYK